MAPSADAPLDVFALVELLLPGVALSADQLAVVRAASTRLQTDLFALRSRARREGRGWTGPSPAERAAMQAAIVADLRTVLDDDQRAVLDRNLQRLGGAPAPP